MKKINLILLSTLLFCCLNSFTQTSQQIDINNINARVNTKGFLFGDPNNFLPGFEAPKGSGKHSVYIANLWLGNATNLAASSYFIDTTDFYNGPLNNLGTTDPSVEAQYNKVWKVTKTEIDYHIGVTTGVIIDPGYVVPSNIADWPAHGNVSMGYEHHLAPFIDFNNDNFYEPLDGDYPDIKGDMATYIIYNDYSTHNFSGGQPIKAEIHQMVYAYGCNNDEALNNTIFVDYKIINKSTSTYNNFYFGMWSDIDIGNPTNEYVQCDVNRGCYFQFNEEATDVNIGSTLGYGDYHPTQGVVILAGPYKDNDGSDNPINEGPNGIGFGDGIMDNERLGMTSFMHHISGGASPWLRLPSTAFQLHGIMDAYWADTTHLKYGWVGHEPHITVNIPARFVYPGSSDSYGYGTSGFPQASWTKDNSTLGTLDNKSVGSMGPITFEPGNVVELEIAYIFAQDNTTTGVQPGKNLFIQYVDHIKNLYTNNNISCSSTTNLFENEQQNDITIYPNPANDYVTVQTNNQSVSIVNFYSIEGKLLQTSQLANTNKINIEKFQQGIYFLEVISENKKEILKLIKN
ncbi:MAG: hypothetical protein CMD31_09115 [Flavobacteriales bacterium]|nr:T9SS type A sorting domain-containing protein [Flavobacteriales bacterium]MBQ20901.1 hypothetical protein [Flavobacteriales bacterium]|tara:strand:- start:27042 stop:28760 length:1719 start_codon:yes stop_codon:yes gene_type:complete